VFTAFGVRLPAVDISRVCAALSLAGGDRRVKSISHFAAVPTEKAHYAQSVVREASGTVLVPSTTQSDVVWPNKSCRSLVLRTLPSSDFLLII
jgi:hypothetical protein